jgi:hypothetical protein
MSRLAKDPPEPSEREIVAAISALYDVASGVEWAQAARRLGLNQHELVRKIALSELRSGISQKKEE